jgi:hypothetical protein
MKLYTHNYTKLADILVFPSVSTETILATDLLNAPIVEHTVEAAL